MAAPSVSDTNTHALAADLFLRLVDLPPEARETALRAEPNDAVREGARSLLGGHTASDGPLDAPLVERALEDGPDPRLGRRVGPWELAEVIGRGGMGVVYRARRADGAYEQEVALKLLHAGPDSGSLAARLRAERQILARLEHPRIARLYDGGVTDDGASGGAPYLVMELVHGEPITAYASARGLSVRDRVRLAVAVCEGVAYAHQRLVVHRDLKPSNILVASGESASTQARRPYATAPGARGDSSSGAPLAPSPRVKLLDFGIAKLLGDDSDDLTRTQAALTPAYAAPEQLRGGDVTTATDVYALGVLIYELLAGDRPYHLSAVTAAEAERIVCETMPPPPSSIAPEARRREIRGDLDTVVSKALAKEPTRRYASAEALAADLQRHLDGLPVLARPATAAYRTSRFVRRHRTAVAAASLVLLALVSGSAVALWQAAEARAEATKAAVIQDFLMDMLSAANPEEEGRDVRVADLLDRAAGEIDSTLADQPDVRAEAHKRLGMTYYELGLLDEADAQLRSALRLFETLDGARALSTASAQRSLGDVRRELADYDGADSLYALSLATHIDLVGERDVRTAAVLAEIGTLRYYTGDNEASADAHRRVLAIEEALLPPNDIETVLTIGNYAVALSAQGETEEATRLFERQVRLYRTVHTDQPVSLANTLANLGSTYVDADRLEDAAEVQRESVRLFREALGDAHPSTAFGLSNLGSTLTKLGRAREAEPLLRESVSVYRTASGERHPNVGFPLVNLAKALRDQGRLDEAERAVLEAADLFREGFGEGHPTEARIRETLASIEARRRG